MRSRRGSASAASGCLKPLFRCMSLLFLGSMTMILTAGRGADAGPGAGISNGDAANAIQNIIGQIQEASTFSLPTSNGRQPRKQMDPPDERCLLSQFSTTCRIAKQSTRRIELVTPAADPADKRLHRPSDAAGRHTGYAFESSGAVHKPRRLLAGRPANLAGHAGTTKAPAVSAFQAVTSI